MEFNDFVKLTVPSDRYGHRPRIVCNNGFSMSVKGGVYSYSSPRDISREYSAMEIGFPSTREPLIQKYAENPDLDQATETVYPYTPVSVIENVLAKHGGINVAKTFEDHKPNNEKLRLIIQLTPKTNNHE